MDLSAFVESSDSDFEHDTKDVSFIYWLARALKPFYPLLLAHLEAC